ncbi:molecular chaperone DnaJ [Bacteroides stercoris]|jgi:DnaJ-class molecular chaperone|uniref:Molecular chaperone DnaJ n=1 Tax=Bacteroides stercoris TaxID=46506 RepID=A0A413V701_BACSE|nr:molecular chaperone DnaJ [Bacteroides stercoris]RHB29346.1 molecular chaperone DnaJ [Bacteroides stercoris]DAP47135.1 MAG TPA: antitermination protein [Caudoviricetes sp.]DAY51729.1 MAG TPA: antitermination protein [Caudoviricetes sp.]
MENTKNIAPHVMACKRCEGKGRIFYTDRDGASSSCNCPVCLGSGRVKVQSKVITRIEPFVPGKDDTELLTM